MILIRLGLCGVFFSGQKSGMYWLMRRDTGEMIWGTRVGNGGNDGGLHFGSAFDGERIYCECF